MGAGRGPAAGVPVVGCAVVTATELLGASDVELNGTMLINLISGDSAQAREAAQWAEQRGARYLDGAITAVPPAIGTAEAMILHSGPQPHFEAHKLADVEHPGGSPDGYQ